MANRPRKPKSGTNVRYTWRPEIVVSWAVIRLNADGSETHLGSEQYEEVATRWATMMDRAAQEDISKRPATRRAERRPERGPERPSERKPSAVQFVEAVERPEQQITFPWRLFSRRPA
jgi:hypothetical protein